MDKKKRFVIPELEIVEFTNDDIITLSGEFEDPDYDPTLGDVFGGN